MGAAHPAVNLQGAVLSLPGDFLLYRIYTACERGDRLQPVYATQARHGRQLYSSFANFTWPGYCRMVSGEMGDSKPSARRPQPLHPRARITSSPKASMT